jgi:hypothetical protein
MITKKNLIILLLLNLVTFVLIADKFDFYVCFFLLVFLFICFFRFVDNKYEWKDLGKEIFLDVVFFISGWLFVILTSLFSGFNSVVFHIIDMKIIAIIFFLSVAEELTARWLVVESNIISDIRKIYVISFIVSLLYTLPTMRSVAPMTAAWGISSYLKNRNIVLTIKSNFLLRLGMICGLYFS